MKRAYFAAATFVIGLAVGGFAAHRIEGRFGPAPAIEAPLTASVSAPISSATPLQVCFSPPLPGGCEPTDTIVNALSDAKKTVLVQAYKLTSKRIGKALVDAHQRGVQVQVILDRSARTDYYTEADFLAHAGIVTGIDQGAIGIAHNKVMIIDSRVVITGSFNFTSAAEARNAENLLVITDPAVAAQYMRNWDDRARQSVVYATPETRAAETTPGGPPQMLCYDAATGTLGGCGSPATR